MVDVGYEVHVELLGSWIGGVDGKKQVDRFLTERLCSGGDTRFVIRPTRSPPLSQTEIGIQLDNQSQYRLH
jgi:hypothetical protein